MKKLTATVMACVTLVPLMSGCGGSDTDATTEPSSTPSSQMPSEDSSTPADNGGDRVLVGMVGEADEPEAFTIALTDESGEPVKTLAAGDYQVKVSDPATLHNFHLTGPGVDESTSVSGTDDVTWKVTLKPGSYTFVCDPHPDMVGDVKVT